MERRRKVRSNKGYVSIFVIEKKLGFFFVNQGGGSVQ